MELPYTICFCCYQQQILLLHRTFPPNAQLWNGLGGKLEAGETPINGIMREMAEEADIDLRCAASVFFAGITTWFQYPRTGQVRMHRGQADNIPVKGMYTFIAHLSQKQAERVQTRETPEGLLAWKPRAWVCDPNNQAVVSNIPLFLPPMLEAREPYEYFCEYQQKDFHNEALRHVVLRPLPRHIVLSECQA